MERRRRLDAAGPRTLQLTIVLGMVALLPGATFSFDSFALPKEIVLIVGGLAGALLVLSAAKRVRLGSLDVLFALYLALTVCSAALATNSWLALRALGLTAGAVALYYAVRGLSPRWRSGIERAVVLGIVTIAVSVVVEAYGVIDRISMPGRVPGGLIGHRNFAAHTLVLGLPLLGVTILRARSWRDAAPAIIGTTLAVCAIVLTRCRAAWLAALAQLFVLSVLFVVAGARRFASAHRLRVVAIAAAIAVGLAAALVLPNALQWKSGYGKTTSTLLDHDRGSGHGRVIQYRASIRLTGQHPWLGVGPGNWSVEYPAVATLPDPSFSPNGHRVVPRFPNTDWFAIAAERGLVALLVLAGAGLFVLGACLRRLSAPADIDGESAPVATALLLTGLAITGLFDTVFHRPAPAIVLVCGLALYAPTRAAWLTWRPPRWGSACGVALGSCLALVVATQHLQQLSGLHELSRGASFEQLVDMADAAPGDHALQSTVADGWLRQGDCHNAARYARRAIRAYPHHRRARGVLLRCRADHHESS